MKIDLHIHTKKISSGDGEARNINDPIRFNEIMKESKIGICAITNHNHFDLEQYNKFKCPEESYILLPGVEIDIYIKGDKSKRRQLNIIWDPNEILIFVEKIKQIQNVSDINPLKFEEAIKIFDFKNTIFF